MAGPRLELRTIVVTVPTAGSPEPITTTNTFTNRFELHVPTGNGGSAFIGDAATTDLTTTIPRATASTTVFESGGHTSISAVSLM